MTTPDPDWKKALLAGIQAPVDRSTPGRNRLQTLAPWVIALASVVVAAALVVIALMSAQTRDAEREQACGAKRQALVAEIAAVPEMGAAALKAAYGTSGNEQTWPWQQDVYAVQAWLAKQLPDC